MTILYHCSSKETDRQSCRLAPVEALDASPLLAVQLWHLVHVRQQLVRVPAAAAAAAAAEAARRSAHIERTTSSVNSLESMHAHRSTLAEETGQQNRSRLAVNCLLMPADACWPAA
jgi:hypothetical protein